MSDQLLLRTDERLRGFRWPAVYEIDVPSIGRDDCLVVCAGFEERSVDTLRRVCEAGATGVSLIIISYLPEHDANRVDTLRAFGRDGKFDMVEVTYDRHEPTGIGDVVRNRIGSCEHVFVDISGMSRLLIVQLLVALLDVDSRLLSLIYGEAREYYPSKEQYERDRGGESSGRIHSYLSSGIFEIAAAAELSSVSMAGEAIRLVAFPSFDPAQLTNLIEELQPTYTDLIHGIPPRDENGWRMDAILGLNTGVLSDIRDRRDRSASTLDYRETLRVILGIYAERSMFDRLVISPTGSKMQSVAVGLLRHGLHDVQIVYPTPSVFAKPEEYTSGVRQLYQLDIPIDAVSIVGL